MSKGRFTIPTDESFVEGTKIIAEKWGADAVRDCDGTKLPANAGQFGKVYNTYFIVRGDNEWARKHPEEAQRIFLLSNRNPATEEKLEIEIMKGFLADEFDPDYSYLDLWQVYDRTTGEEIKSWKVCQKKGVVEIENCKPFHEYTATFLARVTWHPVQIYNYLTNEWTCEKQLTYDPAFPNTKKYIVEHMKKWCEENPETSVVRFTTFLYQFTLIFNNLGKERQVEWFGYGQTANPVLIADFEKESGIKLVAEDFVDSGYYNNCFRTPTEKFRKYMDFVERFVSKTVRELVDIVHSYGKEAMMFLGDHWIGTEPFMKEFATIGLDAVVGSVGNGSTLRLISDIEGVKYTEGRFLPYFFPDTFHEGGDPVKEAKENWITARRAILRKPIDRIGYGGYLKLTLDFPEFLDYVESVCNEFRELYENIRQTTPYCVKKVAVLNSWGKIRSWGCHMVHHALYQKQNYSYAGIIEALSGAPFEVSFLSFDDILADPGLLKEIDVIINVGDGDTAHTGGAAWENPAVAAAIRKFVYEGGGFIGVGEPSGHAYQGHYLQLADLIGVEKETGFTLNYDKYNWEEHPEHFILQDITKPVDFGEGKKNMYAYADTEILVQRDREVQMAVNEFGKGRSVYISGLPYSFENSRILYRSILWSAHGEDILHCWYSENFNVEVHAYVENGKYCVVNNTYEPQETTVYCGDGSSFFLKLEANEIKWYSI